MALTVKDVIGIVESHAPVLYREGYDNVGLMVGDEAAEVKGILFSLDTTLKVIEEAREKGANLIVSHHPMMFNKPSSITTGTVQGKKVIDLIKHGISVYSAHTNLDSVKNGMNDRLVRMFGFKEVDIMEQCEFDYDSGIGRLVYVRSILTLEGFLKKTAEILGTENIRYTGRLNKKLKRIAIINGSGQSFFKQAVEMRADCILTGDTSYHEVLELEEMDICLVDPGHFASERAVFNLIMREISSEITAKKNVPVFFSETEKDPYSIYTGQK